MHELAWPLAGLLGAFAILHAYRFLRGTVADTIFLVAITAAAMLAGYLLG